MTLWWIGNILLLVVVLPVVVYLLKGVFDAARRTTASVEALRPVAQAGSDDLDAAELLHTTREQVNRTVRVVGDYGGSLDQILEDAPR